MDSAAKTITVDLKSDPLYEHQWHLANTGQTNFSDTAGTAGEDLNLDSVIAGGTTGKGSVVSVLDDGLEIAHEDLAANVLKDGS